jgi:propanol-preferring alcohol dehydrogenase
MKAVRLTSVGQPLQLQELAIPEVGPRDMLVRIKAAGICHSDTHYRSGRSTVPHLPVTPGHEVAGIVEQVGNAVTDVKIGDRVCLHYNLTCGNCYYCSSGNDQFCPQVLMLGRTTDGGYAEYIVVPARNAVPLPDEIPFEQGATLMCASATALHALNKSRLKAGETVAVFGVGGLGISAIQLAKAFGALEVFAVDINPEKLKLAEQYRAIPVNAKEVEPVAELRRLTKGKGVNVALEMIGLSLTMRQAVQSLAVLGRAVIVGINDKPIEIDTKHEVMGGETEIIGSNDHLRQELPLLIDLVQRKLLDTSHVVAKVVPLEAAAINQTLDALEQFSNNEVRTVIVP